jgi:hypothetical protein
MISDKDIDFRYLAGLVNREDDTETELIGDLGLDNKAYERMTMYLGAMLCGDRVEVGDVQYGMLADVETGSLTCFKTEPDQPKVGNRITVPRMITEWAYLWFDAAPPTLIEKAA